MLQRIKLTWGTCIWKWYYFHSVLTTCNNYSELEIVEEHVGDSEDVNDGLLLYQDEESEEEEDAND